MHWPQRLILICFLLCAPLLAVLPASSSAQNTVSIGIVADNEPYSSFGANGPEGFSVDILNKVSEISGVNFDYRVGSWTDIYAAFLRGELDALDEVSWREDRVRLMRFTRPYHLRRTIIMHDANRPLAAADSLADLKGKRIGVLRDVYYLHTLRDAGLDLIEYNLQPEMIQALSFGWVDAIIGSEVTLSYFARQKGLVSLQPIGPAPLGGQENEDFRIAVQPELTDLHQKLETALADIDPEWLENTREKWQEFGGKSLQAPQFQLTPAQKALLRQQGPLRVGLMRDYAPLSFEDGGQVQGLTVDILARIMDLTGLRAVPVVGQWSQLIALFQRGEIDIMANISDLPARREFSRFTQPYHFVSVVGFSQSPDFRLTRKEDLYGLRVGYGAGIFYADALHDALGKDAIAFDDQASMFVALANGQVDLVLAALDNGNHWIRDRGLRNIHIAGELHLDDIVREDLRFAIRPELEALVPVLNQALNGITPSEMRVIENRWLGAYFETSTNAAGTVMLSGVENAYLTQKNRTLTFCAHRDWMPLDGINAKGQHQGIASGFLRLVSRRLGIETRLYETASWRASLDALQAGRCDLLPGASNGSGLQNHSEITYSAPYYSLPTVLLGRIESPFITTLAELERSPIGITRDFGLFQDLRVRHPNLNLIPVANEAEGLRKVQSGELYGYIGTLATTSQQLQDLRLADIRVIGRVPMDTTLAVATVKGNPILAGIMQKVVGSAGADELNQIENQWRSVHLNAQVDYSLVWQLMAGALVLLLGFYAWNRKLRSLNRQLEQANAQLAELSATDQLTGLGNRTRFDQTYDILFQHCLRSATPFLVAMVDIDHFKRINDDYGHAAGDECLKVLAETLRSHFQRTGDHVIRFGGEEFVIFAAIASVSEAHNRLELMRVAVSAMPIQYETQVLHLTISIGYCLQTPTKKAVATHWLLAADQALYRAKSQGRNRVVQALSTGADGAS